MMNYKYRTPKSKYKGRIDVIPFTPEQIAEYTADHYIRRYVINNVLPDSWRNARWQHLDTREIKTTYELCVQLILDGKHRSKDIVRQLAEEYISRMNGTEPRRSTKRLIWLSFRLKLIEDME